MTRRPRIPSRSTRSLIAAMAGIAVAAWLGWGWRMTHPSHEGYQVVGQHSGYEVRDYGPLTVAQTTVLDRGTDAFALGAGILHPYFGGDNLAAAIADPIAEPTGQRLAPMAVLMGALRDDGWRISAPLPAGMDSADAPRPDDPRIRLIELPAQRVAVLTFYGTSGQTDGHEAKLRSLLDRDGIAASGTVTIIRYGVPGVPPFFRRSTVLIPIR